MVCLQLANSAITALQYAISPTVGERKTRRFRAFFHFELIEGIVRTQISVRNDAGTAAVYTIMNSTYTYSCHYPVPGPYFPQRQHAKPEKIELIQHYTIRTRDLASIDLPVPCALKLHT